MIPLFPFFFFYLLAFPMFTIIGMFIDITPSTSTWTREIIYIIFILNLDGSLAGFYFISWVRTQFLLLYSQPDTLFVENMARYLFGHLSSGPVQERTQPPGTKPTQQRG